MNKAGRLAFVKSVLSAIPIHQLMVLAPPKKIVKLFEKIDRGFLWEGRAAANGGICHVNWRMVCRPIAHGGLGVQDMKRVGLALRLRWLWYSRTDEGRAWSGLDLQFSKTSVNCSSPPRPCWWAMEKPANSGRIDGSVAV
jgi:hypothetical protein